MKIQQTKKMASITLLIIVGLCMFTHVEQAKSQDFMPFDLSVVIQNKHETIEQMSTQEVESELRTLASFLFKGKEESLHKHSKAKTILPEHECGTSHWIRYTQLLARTDVSQSLRSELVALKAAAEPSTWVSYVASDYFADNPGETGFHFTIQYAPSDDLVHRPTQTDDDTDGRPDYIEDVARYLEHGRNQYENFGFLVQENLTIRVYDIPFGGFVSFNTLGMILEFAIDNSLNPDNKLKTTSVHEYFHSIQIRYRTAYSDYTSWIYEGTAKWVEDVLFDDLNMDFNYGYLWFINDKLSRPEDTLAGEGASYEAVLYWKYFGEQYGSDGSIYSIDPFFASIGHTVDPRGVNVIRELWEELDVAILFNDWTSEVDTVLQNHGTNWQLSFEDWLIANYIKDYQSSSSIDIYDYLEDEEAAYDSVEVSNTPGDDLATGSYIYDSQSINKWAANYWVFTLDNTVADVTVEINGTGSGPIGDKSGYNPLYIIIKINSSGMVGGWVDYGSGYNNDFEVTFQNENYTEIIVIVAALNNGGNYSLGVNERVIYPPVPDLKANGLDGTSVTIPSGTNCDISFDLDPGSYNGTLADLFVGYRYFISGIGEFEDMQVYQMPLETISGSIRILDDKNSYPGSWLFFYLAVDLVPNGWFDADQGYIDVVGVMVE